MHYFKRNIGDYHKKAGRLSMLEHGAYTLLLDACYDRERFPTLDEAIEWAWARSDEEIAAVKFVLSKFFTLLDGIYLQERVLEEIELYHAKSAKNKEIAIAREEAKRNRRTRSEHVSCSSVNESAPNHKPLTINQEPVTKKEDQEPLPSSPAKTARKTKIPDPFMLTADMRQWAADTAPAVDVRSETENFVDYWRGEAKTKADWPATWRNWMRRAQKDAGSRRGQPGGFVNRQQQIEDANMAVVAQIREQERQRMQGGVQDDFIGTGETIIEGEVIHA